MSKTIGRRLEQLETHSGSRRKVLAIHSGKEYTIPSEGNRRLSESEFQRWRSGLGANTMLVIVRMWNETLPKGGEKAE